MSSPWLEMAAAKSSSSVKRAGRSGPSATRALHGKALVKYRLGWFEKAMNDFELISKEGNGDEPDETLAIELTDPLGSFDTNAVVDWLERQEPLHAVWRVASVHRGAATKLREMVQQISGARTEGYQLYELTHEDLSLSIRLPAPERVGIDRLVAAVAASRLRQPDRPLIVVDHGSAITTDLIDIDGAFIGGAIAPGMAMGVGGSPLRT